MMKTAIGKMIDEELKDMELSEELKNRIRIGKRPQKSYRTLMKIAVLCAAATTVYAGYYAVNRILINGEELPELDPVQTVEFNKLDEGLENENGIIDEEYKDYDEIKEVLGIRLLDTQLSKDNPYMIGKIYTDNDDFAIIRIEYYILGDTGNYQYDEEGKFYSYERGTDFWNPATLTVEVNPSADTEYLGYFQYVESYTSAQGYKVNIAEDTTGGENIENYISDKIAIFVADGIRYKIKARTSLEILKAIVDSMEYL